YYLPRVLAIFLLGWLPLVGVAAPVLGALFGAWMMTVQFCDYGADNQGIDFPRLRQALRARRLTCLAFGGCVMAGLLVPVFNLLVIPAAVAGGTALWVRELRPLVQR